LPLSATTRVAREAHSWILKLFGRYPDEVVNGYVQRIGEQIVAAGGYDELLVRCVVLDQPEVFSFVLPGFVYVSRGLLLLLRDENELAALLAHEIGHILLTPPQKQNGESPSPGIRHALFARPLLRSAITDKAVQRAVARLSELLARGYTADEEARVDDLAIGMLAQAGYDPRAMLGLQQVVIAQRQAVASDKAGVRDLYSPHYRGIGDKVYETPLARRLKKFDPLRIVQTDRLPGERFFTVIDGMVYGDNPALGVRTGRQYTDIETGFVVRFPEDWRIINGNDYVTAIAPGNHALMELQVAELGEDHGFTPKTYLERVIPMSGRRTGGLLSPNGFNGYTSVGEMDTLFGRKPVRVTVVFLQDNAVVLLGTARSVDTFEQLDIFFLEASASLRPVSQVDRQLAAKLVVKVIRVGSELRWGDLIAQSPLVIGPETQLRLLNRLYPNGELQTGRPLKLVQRGKKD